MGISWKLSPNCLRSKDQEKGVEMHLLQLNREKKGIEVMSHLKDEKERMLIRR